LAIAATFCPKKGELAANAHNVPLTTFVVGCWNHVPETGRETELGYAMSLHVERIEWMPSPPLAPDDGPIDIAHLERMTLGDASLEREVLAMFSAQAVSLISILAAMPSDAAALAHTMKGSARAIGAFRVGDAAASLETAIRSGDDLAEGLAELNDAVVEARAAIDGLLRRS
jgi:HPt (histidine-containing phosphotransfer) domain-containing protein